MVFLALVAWLLICDQKSFMNVQATPHVVQEESCSPTIGGRPSESFVQHRKALLAEKISVASSLFWKTPVASSGPPQLAFFPHVLIVCLMSLIVFGVGYLLWIWRQRGLFSHIRIGLQQPSSVNGAMALLIYLALLVTLDLTIKREAEIGGGHYATSPFLLVAAVELGKLIVTLALYVWQTVGVRNVLNSAGDVHQVSKESAASITSVALHMLPVAIIFNVNNLLNLLVLSLVRLDAYAVWRNVSILFNAIIWVWVLNKRLEVHRWVAITTCALGCSFNSLSPDGTWDLDAAVLGVLLTAFLSSLASVLNEKVIKSSLASQFTIDQLNLILYSETLGLMLVFMGCYYLAFKQNLNLSIGSLISTFTAGSLKIVVVQIALGLSVSRVLKYADAVAKTVVGSLRDVVIVFVAPHVVSATRFDLLSVGSACLVGLAGMIYFAPTVEPTLGQSADICPGKSDRDTDESIESKRESPLESER